MEHTADSEKDPTAAYAVRHLKSRILYPEAFQGVDIGYTIGPESLKEDLVLKQADAVHAFTWRYAPGGLKARQEGADIVFEDAGGQGSLQTVCTVYDGCRRGSEPRPDTDPDR